MNGLTDKQFWAGIAEDESYRARVQELAGDYQKAKRETPPALTKKLRKCFLEKGTREEFERPYFKKRTLTAEAALLALIFPKEEAYLTLLKRYLKSTCKELSWALPAHCAGVENELTCVDLFAAETACMLAEICLALSDRLGSELADCIKKQINKRVFQPYIAGRYAWEDGRSNWTAVCCGNIGIAMMRIAPALFEQAKERILNAMSRYIALFPDDGNCPEGLHYWNFGFGRFVWFAQVLHEYSKGQCDLFENEKIKQIACYAQKMFLKGGVAVSISDSDRAGKADAALIHFLHGIYPDACITLSQELTRADFGDIPWLSLSRSFLCGQVPKAAPLPLQNYLFEASHLAIVNTQKYSLCVKAGHNGESHNHNDVGSFILSTDEGQLFCDLGAGRYFNGYFDSKIRYTLLGNASWGHSVPIIDGAYQKEGSQFCGTLQWNDNKITVDFAKAYGGAVKKLTRTFEYAEDEILLTDEFEGCNKVIERFVSVVKPKLIAGGVQIKSVALHCKGATPTITQCNFERHGDTKRRLERVYLIDFVFLKKERAQFCFSLLK